MKKFAKSFIALVLAVAIALPSVTFAAAPEEAALIPVRAFFEEIGATVSWYDEYRAVRIDFEGNEIFLLTEYDAAIINGLWLDLAFGIPLIEERSFIAESDLMLVYLFLNPGHTLLTLPLTEEARDIVLYDFNFLIEQTIENSVWDAVMLDAHGLDFNEIAELFIAFIETMSPLELTVADMDAFLNVFPFHDADDARSLAANYLFALLILEFSPIFGSIGHLGPRDLSLYTVQYTAFMRQLNNPAEDIENNHFLQLFAESFTNEAVVWFYGEIEVDFYSEEHAFPIVEGNIETDIIIPGEVAYLRINTFLANPEYDNTFILPFLQQVQAYDHLIIDLRGNTGGLSSYFMEFIFRRLISEQTTVESVEFFTGGERAMRAMEASLLTSLHMEPSVDWAITSSVEILPAAEFAYQANMYMLADEMLERLENVIVSRSYILPAEDSINFEGQVWLLVDYMSMSASVAAASLALQTGFATVVGQNTSGIMGSTHIYLPLPNTGILWRIDVGHQMDQYGNSLEAFGIAPQIRNFDGLNALETVLAIIEANE